MLTIQGKGFDFSDEIGGVVSTRPAEDQSSALPQHRSDADTSLSGLLGGSNEAALTFNDDVISCLETGSDTTSRSPTLGVRSTAIRTR